MYIFHPVIFKASKATQPGRNGEIQLTDPIQKLVDWGLNVYAIILDKNYAHLDIVAPKGTGMLWTCLISTLQENQLIMNVHGIPAASDTKITP